MSSNVSIMVQGDQHYSQVLKVLAEIFPVEFVPFKEENSFQFYSNDMEFLVFQSHDHRR